MFLEYGVNTSQDYVHISQVNSGRVDLVCPYCGHGLMARKGHKLAHHFAHDGKSCNLSKRDFQILDAPLFDRFHTFIDNRTWQALQTFYDGQTSNNRLLADKELITLDNIEGKQTYHLTELGKIPFGLATLATFANFQLSKVYDRHQTLSSTIQHALYGKESSMRPDTYDIEPNPHEVASARIDLNIYRQQIKRLFSLDLYLLHITTDTYDNLYKIGVTTDIDRRISQIERDLSQIQITVKQIELLSLLRHRGAVEHYAHHRYREDNLPIDTLTEYFRFDERKVQEVLSDFRALGDLELVTDENYYLTSTTNGEEIVTRIGLMSSILNNKKPAIDQHIAGQSKTDNQLLLEQHPQVVAYIEENLPPQVIARKCRVSLKTVYQIEAILNDK